MIVKKVGLFLTIFATTLHIISLCCDFKINEPTCKNYYRITISLNAFIRTSSELENYVVSVERIDEYTHVHPEVRMRNDDT